MADYVVVSDLFGIAPGAAKEIGGYRIRQKF
jgi:hypothetical protein